ncbi:MAG TPA: glycosyltransferase [Anaerolineales bacterium]|nr:glycosyltransferase [Anaerolineales bacterium]
MPEKAHVVFFFSDTGGGHRSAAEAIIEAMQSEYGGMLSMEMVDFFRGFGPGPMRSMPRLYPEMVKAKRLWQASFYATNGRAQARVLTASLWPLMKPTMERLVDRHPADLYVSVHPLATTTAIKAMGSRRPPFYTVVTDLVTTHALWFDARADRILVPTEMARQRAIAYRMPADKLEVVGLPVAQRYCTPAGNKPLLRRRLGWPADLPMILLVGGGEGMGPLAKTARAIDECGLRLGLAVICGRNRKLQESLLASHWENPTFIYGFTRDLADFMRAADVIVTKAGPGTITEALNANLPIIMYSKIAGQEDGNVAYVQAEGAGVWAPKPAQVVRTLTRWLSRPEERRAIAEAARRAARPDSARTVARLLGERLRLTQQLARAHPTA